MNQNFFQKSAIKHAGEIQCRTFSKLVDCGSCIFFPDRVIVEKERCGGIAGHKIHPVQTFAAVCAGFIGT